MMRSTLFALGIALTLVTHARAAGPLYSEVEQYVKGRLAEVDQIPAERREQLLVLARYISERQSEDKPVKLLFVCTHNSRRSHLAQVWAQVGADYFGLGQVTTYSGGTEATAMNSRTVAALQRAGLKITSGDTSSNPKYAVTFAHEREPMFCFSKTLTQQPNPTKNFAAVMTCSQADAACPTVPGADLRLRITYDDPKVSDGTATEAATYDERSRQIAREMVFVMSQAAKR